MAKKSNNPECAEINKYYIIQWKIQGENKTQLVSAGKYEEIVGTKYKISHFKKVLEFEKDVYTFFIRKHLRIKFFLK